MPEYRLESRNRDGTYLATLPARNIQGESLLNKADNLRFELPLYHDDVKLTKFYPGKTEVVLLRDDVIVFQGPLWDATFSSERATVSCTAEGLESYLDVRRVDDDIDWTREQGQACWDLISDSQAKVQGELYLTKGTVQAGPTRTFVIRRAEGKYISDVIGDIADLSDGFDWKIQHSDRKFRVWYPAKQDVSLARLEYSGAIRHYAVQLMGKYARNVILVQGPKNIIESAIDTAARVEYGRRDYVDAFKDAVNRAEVTERAELVRKLRKKAKMVPNLSVPGDKVNAFDGELTWGQKVKVVIKDGPLDIDEEMRCIGFQFTIGNQGQESFNYYMNDLTELEA